MPTITITADDMQSPLIINFCDLNKFKYEISRYSPAETEALSHKLKTPTQSFKYFCGSEMLTVEGKIQPLTALHFILDYARRKELLGITALGLDERLQEAFNTTDASFPISDISQRVNKLFVD